MGSHRSARSLFGELQEGEIFLQMPFEGGSPIRNLRCDDFEEGICLKAPAIAAEWIQGSQVEGVLMKRCIETPKAIGNQDLKKPTRLHDPMYLPHGCFHINQVFEDVGG